MGRLLGIDFGLRSVGFAICDRQSTIAGPLEVYVRKSEKADAAHFQAIVQENEVEAIILGLPLHLNGEESSSSYEARKYGAWIKTLTNLPLLFHDERYTTTDAEELLREANIHFRKRKSKRDKLAAQSMLQNFVDRGCPGLEEAIAIKTRAGGG